MEKCGRRIYNDKSVMHLLLFSSSKYKVTKAAGRIFYCTLVMIATENATKYSAGVTSVIHLVNQSKSSILCVFKCITTVV